MSSLVPDFEYDVFISYRQKDNKGDNWVSDFVEDLKTELDKTFKEEISVYFDINPHNGLLETHDVDASLLQKLKCLVLIPILSQTYCDPKSFAFAHEYTKFVELATHDRFGLKIRLSDGNVANRVIPVRIYDLETADIKLFESVLGGPLRGIEFIYKEPGVNRPMSRSDSGEKNLNGIRYRNQINRVANAIRDIVNSIKTGNRDEEYGRRDLEDPYHRDGMQDKSIIVLPFENISSDPGQEYFSNGLTEEVISDLAMVPELLVISRSSAMSFRGSRNTIKEIADKVNVRYVLEGSVRKEANNLRIFAQLIDSVNESHVWAEKYAGTIEDVFDIQEQVSHSIVNALKIKLNTPDRTRLRERQIDNAFAYDYYKKAYPEIASFNRERIEAGLELLQQGLEIQGENALIYAGMAFAHFQLLNAGVDQETNLRKATEYVNKAFSINEDLPEAHFTMSFICSMAGRPDKAMSHITKAYILKPDNPEIMVWLAFAYILIGQTDKAKALLARILKIDPVNPMIDSLVGWIHFYNGRFDLALDPLLGASNLDPESKMNRFWKAFILVLNDRAEEASAFITDTEPQLPGDSWSELCLFLKYAINDQKEELNNLMTPEVIKTHSTDPINSYLLSTIYSSIGEKEKALKWLENAVARGFMNYPMLNEHDPFVKNIRDEKRFQDLMKRVKRQYERFEIYSKVEI